MTRFVLILVFLLFVSGAASAQEGLVNISVVTSKGWVAYAVSDKWKILTRQTEPPKTACTFQLPNPADEGTPDSTNLVVLTFGLDSPEARAAAARLTKKLRTESKPTPAHGP